MLSTTLPAYPYQQYADDDDVQAFFAAYNAATQTYVTWFAGVGLPFYPGLSAPLLDWVAYGLYGMQRTSLAVQTSGATGAFNTEPFNNDQFNGGTAATETYYALSDDAFQRILTWNFYKGDCRYYSIPWLKRRIMRFLLGVSGIDPAPWLPGFSIGAEQTWPISVSVGSGTVTVGLNQAVLSALSGGAITPGITVIFQLAFESGILELPLQYTGYVVDIETNLVANVSPSTESSAGLGASQTTGTATVTASSGSGSYTYAWSWASGGSGITITSAAAAATTFSASALTQGETVSGVALCTVTDTVTSQTAGVTVAVSLERYSAPAAVAAPTSLSAVGASATESTGVCTVSVTGGVMPYTYAWTWQSGGSGITIGSPSAASTVFSASSLSPGNTDTGTALCTVTDALGQTSTATCAVSIERVSLPSASASPASLSYTGASATESTASTTVTASGGQSPYTYAWAWSSGGASIAINEAGAATTNFTATGLSAGASDSGTAQCTVTDAFGQKAYASCAVSIARATTLSASVSPASQSVVGTLATLSTGTSTVSASGGGTPYTYAWAWSSGGAGISIGSAAAAATTFTASGLAQGQTDSGVAACTVTDLYGQQAVVTVTVSIERATQVSASISPSSLSATGANAEVVTAYTTVTASGGITPYTYAWSWAAGGSGITIDFPAADSTNFYTTALAPGGTDSGTAQCVVTDSLGQTATVTCAVSIERVTLVSLSVSPSALDASGTATTQTTGAATATPSGGAAPYIYTWSWITGGSGLTINSVTAAATTVTGAGMTRGDNYTGTLQCQVQDAYGQQATASTSVDIVCDYIGSALITSGVLDARFGAVLYGYESGEVGALVNSSIPAGTLFAAVTVLDGGAYTTYLEISAASDPTQSYFSTLVTFVGSQYNLSTSSAAYTYSGGVAQWAWSGVNIFGNATAGQNYTVDLG